MTEELITPDNVSKQLLKSILDDALFETSYDADGDIRVEEDLSFWVLPSKEQGRIKLLANFGFLPDCPREDRLEAVNKINRQYIVVKASVADNDILRFEYDILIAGGITRKAFLLAVKRFSSIPKVAILEHCFDMVR